MTKVHIRMSWKAQLIIRVDGSSFGHILVSLKSPSAVRWKAFSRIRRKTRRQQITASDTSTKPGLLTKSEALSCCVFVWAYVGWMGLRASGRSQWYEIRYLTSNKSIKTLESLEHSSSSINRIEWNQINDSEVTRDFFCSRFLFVCRFGFKIWLKADKLKEKLEKFCWSNGRECRMTFELI